ncbi:MAG: DNA-processing protein DprA [Candidatus Marinimicrobia bacterium]|nr:DNA-processing protein DprA [Candidatus Neomarinimicrobiota bacterium]
MNKDFSDLIRILSIPGVGPRKSLDLITAFGSLEKVFSADFRQLTQISGIKEKTAQSILLPPDEDLIAGQYQLTEKFEVEIIPIWDDAYPDSLKQIYDPPIALFCRGNIELLKQRSVAIVGTRTPTRYGKETAVDFAQGLVKSGYAVVSGGAKGIDTYVHTACLRSNGPTIVVLGNGIDRVYPAENRTLYDEIGNQGLLVSEFLMGSKPDAPNFPRRNRIISGLSLGTLVIEAAERSGSLITAYFALDQNREVFAVPGAINSRQSRGTNGLIRQGAKLVESVDDILSELGDKFQLGQSGGQQELSIGLDAKEQEVYEKIKGDEAIQIDDLAVETDQTTFSLLSILLQLEMKGLVQQLPGKYFKRRA